MPARPLVLFPDPRLRLKAEPIDVFDEALAGLTQDLIDTLVAAPAIGLTAPHIGVSQRLVVIRLADDAIMRVYANPAVVWTSPEMKSETEGSVSMPGLSEQIERPARIGLTWQDLAGKPQEGEADGFLAVVLQHEIDQLDGIFWIDRLSRLKRERLVKRFEKTKRRA